MLECAELKGRRHYGESLFRVSVLATKMVQKSHKREGKPFVLLGGLSHILEELMLWILFALGAALSWG
jgi:hypothetical protein